MAIVKLYLHVCKQAAVCQKTVVTELVPLLSLKKPGLEKLFPDLPAQHRWGLGNLGTGTGLVVNPAPGAAPRPAAMLQLCAPLSPPHPMPPTPRPGHLAGKLKYSLPSEAFFFSVFHGRIGAGKTNGEKKLFWSSSLCLFCFLFLLSKMKGSPSTKEGKPSKCF